MDLKEHIRGIPDFPKSPNFEVAVQRASKKPMQFRPGTQQKYTNANFAIIGKMIEAVSGQPYGRYMHENIFGLLEMNSTGGYREFLKGNHATGYQGEGPNQHEAEPTVTVYGIPSGGMVSTISDLLKLDAAMRAQKLMKPESYQQMYTRTIPPGVNTPWHFTPGWQARMAGNTEVVKAKMRTLESLRLTDEVEDILITLTGQYHLIRLLKKTSSAPVLFMYLALDRSKANLALARHHLKRIEGEITV